MGSLFSDDYGNHAGFVKFLKAKTELLEAGSMEARQVMRLLGKMGMQVVRTNGTHVIVMNPSTGKTTAITATRELSCAAIRDSLKDLGVTTDGL